MLVKDRMSPAVTIEAGHDYKAALALMGEYGVQHLPVVTADGELIGIVVERDLVMAGTRYLQCPVAVSELMQRDVLTVAPDNRTADAAMRMVNHRISGLPVVEGNRRVVGIITDADILRAFIEAMPEESIFNARPAVKRRPPAMGVAEAQNEGTHSLAEPM